MSQDPSRRRHVWTLEDAPHLQTTRPARKVQPNGRRQTTRPEKGVKTMSCKEHPMKIETTASIHVVYSTHGDESFDPDTQLTDAVYWLASNGQLTGDSAATVDTFYVEVATKEIPSTEEASPVAPTDKPSKTPIPKGETMVLEKYGLTPKVVAAVVDAYLDAYPEVKKHLHQVIQHKKEPPLEVDLLVAYGDGTWERKRHTAPVSLRDLYDEHGKLDLRALDPFLDELVDTVYADQDVAALVPYWIDTHTQDGIDAGLGTPAPVMKPTSADEPISDEEWHKRRDAIKEDRNLCPCDKPSIEECFCKGACCCHFPR